MSISSLVTSVKTFHNLSVIASQEVTAETALPWHCREWKLQKRPLTEVASSRHLFSSEMFKAVHRPMVVFELVVLRIVCLKKVSYESRVEKPGGCAPTRLAYAIGSFTMSRANGINPKVKGSLLPIPPILTSGPSNFGLANIDYDRFANPKYGTPFDQIRNVDMSSSNPSAPEKSMLWGGRFTGTARSRQPEFDLPSHC